MLENVALPACSAQTGAAKKTIAAPRTAGAGRADGQTARISPAAFGRTATACGGGARAVNQPEILLADEPTSDLDEQTEQEIMQLLADIHHRTGTTILLVTHTSQLISYGTRALQMAAGTICNGTT